MARKAIVVKNLRVKKEILDAISKGLKPAHPTRAYNRCKLCGRVGGYLRKFEVCRICFREKANEGKIMGIRKSSW